MPAHDAFYDVTRAATLTSPVAIAPPTAWTLLAGSSMLFSAFQEKGKRDESQKINKRKKEEEESSSHFVAGTFKRYEPLALIL